jgi:hypothetical protein
MATNGPRVLVTLWDGLVVAGHRSPTAGNGRAVVLVHGADRAARSVGRHHAMVADPERLARVVVEVWQSADEVAR